jgi:pilus assembly protein CpaF
MRQQIASAINLIVQIARLSDGKRRIVSITEIVGMKDREIVTQEIFKFDRRGVDQDGHVIGDFRPTGARPRFLDQLEVCGLSLPPSMFEPNSIHHGEHGERQ